METYDVGPFSLHNVQNGDMRNEIYPKKRYEDQNGYYVEVQQSFPMIVKTNFDIQTKKVTKKVWNIQKGQDELKTYKEIDEKALSLFIRSFLGEHLQTHPHYPHILYYDVESEKSDNSKDVLTTIICYREASMGLCRPGRNLKYRCFSFDDRLLARYSTYFDETCDDRHTIFLHHLDNKHKELPITINTQLQIESFFWDDAVLIVGSYFNNVKNKYHIDIYNAKEFSKNSNTPGVKDEVFYFLGVDIEYKDPVMKQGSNQDQIFKLVTVEKNSLFLGNQATKKYILVNFAHRRKETEHSDSALITYSLEPLPNEKEDDQKKGKKLVEKPIDDKKPLAPHWFKKHCVPIGAVGTLLLVILLYGCYNKQCASFFTKPF
jgi:hypothetical protein